jgi:hypothetical protein
LLGATTKKTTTSSILVCTSAQPRRIVGVFRVPRPSVYSFTVQEIESFSALVSTSDPVAQTQTQTKPHQLQTHTIKKNHIIYNYIDRTHYKSSIDFSQNASIPRHHPPYVMSPSTRSYIYVFNRFSLVNIMSLSYFGSIIILFECCHAITLKS